MRGVLKWFNAVRRSKNVEAKIEEALNLVGLKTEPPFAQASIDDPLLFLLQSPANDPVPNARRQQNKLNFRPPSQPHDWTVYSLRDKLDRGQLELQPTYKREYVWKLRPELPSRLIESLLLEIPIPPIYFGKMAGGLRLEHRRAAAVDDDDGLHKRQVSATTAPKDGEPEWQIL